MAVAADERDSEDSADAEEGGRLVQSGEMHLKRINDFESPFVTPITDDMPIHSILTLRTVASIVRHHCMIQPNTKEIRRLQERRYRPKAYSQEVQKLSILPGPEGYDNLAKVVHLTKFHKPPTPAKGRSTQRLDRYPPGGRAAASRDAVAASVQQDWVNRKGGISHRKTNQTVYVGHEAQAKPAAAGAQRAATPNDVSEYESEPS